MHVADPIIAGVCDVQPTSTVDRQSNVCNGGLRSRATVTAETACKVVDIPCDSSDRAAGGIHSMDYIIEAATNENVSSRISTHCYRSNHAGTQCWATIPGEGIRPIEGHRSNRRGSRDHSTDGVDASNLVISGVRNEEIA